MLELQLLWSHWWTSYSVIYLVIYSMVYSVVYLASLIDKVNWQQRSVQKSLMNTAISIGPVA
jgi:hypothetical protein